jgi:PHP family Zn ribbon phosphoesterase
MLQLSYDLHIHSCLSPCGDDESTPGNIAGMAAVKGLDVIALCDHNSCKNTPALLSIAQAYGVLAIPGMELTTLEEVHVVCLFRSLAAALDFDAYVSKVLIPIPLDARIFGKQEIRDCNDELCGTVDNLLINATQISFDEVYDLLRQWDAVMVPAHIDKSSNSLIANLGFVPSDSKFHCVEVKNMANWHKLKQANPYLETVNVITDSDAHYIQDINEPINQLYVQEKSIDAVLDALVKKN